MQKLLYLKFCKHYYLLCNFKERNIQHLIYRCINLNCSAELKSDSNFTLLPFCLKCGVNYSFSQLQGGKNFRKIFSKVRKSD